MRIEYLDGPRLRRALIAACQYAQRRRADLNRINVFPVPDGDTGTNLSLTLASIVERLRLTEATSVSAVAREVAEAGLALTVNVVLHRANFDRTAELAALAA